MRRRLMKHCDWWIIVSQHYIQRYVLHGFMEDTESWSEFTSSNNNEMKMNV